MKLLRAFAGAAGVLVLAGCAAHRPPASIEAAAPPRWYAPLPEGGKLADLTQWWTQFGDPLLVELIVAAEDASPDIATAGTRIAEARGNRVSARAALLPSADASVSAQRGNAQIGIPLATIITGVVQPQWEIDLFGGNHARLDAASAQLAGAEAGWHAARVALAAQTATSYVDLRTCERLLEVTRNDARSRAETARLTQLSADAGFTAPAVAAQARASAADSAQRTTQQRAQCDLDVKSLVTLTGLPEPDLRARLAAPWVEPAGIAQAALPSVPAALLAQRPDVFQAEQDVAAASANVGAAHADRFPRLTLSGEIGFGSVSLEGQTINQKAWQIGPITFSAPLFDAGRRAAAEDTARARYDEAVVAYRARVRQAVGEVEQALVNLDAARARSADARVAAEGYRTSFIATEAQYRSGLGSLIEVEDQRRLALSAETTVLNLQHDRIAAWIALYRALGGGWARPDATATARQP